MSSNKFLTPELAKPTYQAQMNALRMKLAGRPYCNEVKALLPDVTKATIHGAVNGRNENELVLSALKIVVHKLDKQQRQAQEALLRAAEEVGFVG